MFLVDEGFMTGMTVGQRLLPYWLAAIRKYIRRPNGLD
jgi:hypothetical protein